MKQTKALALMYAGTFVDQTRLESGIYSKEIPTLYAEGNTMDSLVIFAKRMTDMHGKCFFSESYFENLNDCKLVPVSITIEQIEK